VGHGLFALLAIGILTEVVRSDVPFEAIDWSHITGLAAAVAASSLIAQARIRFLYRLGAHLLVLVWLAEHFSVVSDGSEWVTVAWGVYGAALLLAAIEAGRRRGAYLVRAQALAASALGLAVLKLLLVDLAQVSSLVRIPLFLGFGLALIAVSAFFQRSTRGTTRG